MNSKITKFVKFWLPVFAWAVIIFLFSANPTTRASEIHWQDFIIKKSAHVFVFAVLTTLLYRAFINFDLAAKIAAKYSFLFSIVYAFTDEFHQSFTPGREPTLRDIAFDTVGVLLSLYLIINYLSKAPKVIKLWAEKFEIK